MNQDLTWTPSKEDYEALEAQIEAQERNVRAYGEMEARARERNVNAFMELRTLHNRLRSWKRWHPLEDTE